MQRLIWIITLLFLCIAALLLMESLPEAEVLAQRAPTSTPLPTAPPLPTLPAPPRPTRTPMPDDTRSDKIISPATVCLRLRSYGNQDALRSDLSYDLTLINRSPDNDVHNLTLRLPLPSTDHLAVQTSVPELWVSEVTTNAVVFRLDSLLSSRQLTATVQLQGIHENDTPLAKARAVAEWPTNNRTVNIMSNAVRQNDEQPAVDSTGAYVQLRNAGSSISLLQGQDFTSFEHIGVWTTLADGRSVAVTDLFADANGAFSKMVDLNALPANATTLVVQGACSEITAVIILDS